MSTAAPTELIIEAGHTERNYWRDLFRYRELFYFLAWRDVLVRYKQTVIGILWAVLRPLLTMIVFTFVFSRIAKLPADGIPYPVMVFAAMLPWQLFATSLSEGSGSLINANLISKVYFPRLIVQFGLYISPVGFSSAIVPPKWRLLYDFNPMVGVIDGFRWAISNGRSAFPQQSLVLSLITIAILLASGIWYFRKTERTFADVI